MQHVESGNLELGTLVKVKRILGEFGEEAQTQYLEKLHSMADRKAHKYIEQLDVMKIYLPDKKAMIEQILLFPSDIKEGERRRLAKFISKVDVAFDTLCLQYLGRKKDELNDRILLHIERETNFFLETQGFDFTAVPDNYIEHPPSSIAVVSKNLAVLKALFVRESPMYQLASRTREEIQELVFAFLRNCYIAILYGLGRGLPDESETAEPEKCVQHLKAIIQEIKTQVSPNVMREKFRYSQNITELKLTLSISDEKIRKCSALIAELEVLHAMTIEHEVKEKNVNDVTFGGLVINVFVRLCEEMKTVLEHWDKDSKEKAIKEREAKEREAKEREAKENKDKEEVVEFKDRQTKSERDLSRAEQFSERLTRSFKDLNQASGNWVAARRKAKEAKETKEAYLEGKAKRGGSDLGVGADYKQEDSNQNGKDENLLARSGSIPVEDTNTIVEENSNTNNGTANGSERGVLVRNASKRDLPPVPPRKGRALPSLPPTPTTPTTSRLKETGEIEKEDNNTADKSPTATEIDKDNDNKEQEQEQKQEQDQDQDKDKEKEKEEEEKEKEKEIDKEKEKENDKEKDKNKEKEKEKGKEKEKDKDKEKEKQKQKEKEKEKEKGGKSSVASIINNINSNNKTDNKTELLSKSDSRSDINKIESAKKESSKGKLTILPKGRSGTVVRSLFGSKSDLTSSPKMETSSRPVNPLQLHAAANQNHVNLAYELISQGTFDINIQDKQGWTALHCAAYNMAAGQATAMEMMILLLTVHGIDANIPNDSQTTPLHILAKTTIAAYSDLSSFLPALDLMMIKGASLTQCNSQGEIPLHLACLSGNAEVVKFLLKAGSDPNALTNSQQSCLHYATHRGHTEVVRLLLDYGANANYSAPDGTALAIAERNKNDEIVQIISAASH